LLRHAEVDSEPTAAPDRSAMTIMEIQSRILVAQASLSAADRDKVLGEAAKLLDHGSYEQRLRFVPVAGEIGGAAAALERLKRLEAPADETGEDSAKAVATKALLEKAYESDGALTESEQNELHADLGWFGDLALPSDSALHKAAVRQAWRSLLTIGVVGLAGLLGLVVGFGLVTALFICWQMGVLGQGLKTGSPYGGVYAETFAVWMLLFFGLTYGMYYLPRSMPHLLLSGLAMLTSLVALGWPLLRGVRWPTLCYDLGLNFGRRPLLQLLTGVGTYLAALPMLAVGVVLMLGLMALRQRLAAAGGEGPLPTHPLSGMVFNGGWWVRLQALFAAAMVAPLVEETMFRGVLYRHLRESSARWARPLSVIVSGLLTSFVFAALHPQGWMAVPPLMALALTFTVAREWRQSLVPAVVAHSLNNAFICLLLVLLGL
jgi:membrane protease YdiL (CAAX protease family)